MKSVRSSLTQNFLLAASAMLVLLGIAASPAFAQGSGYKVIHSFSGIDGDGQLPTGDLVSDATGNLYGTTSAGGVYNDNCTYPEGCGTVFKLTKTPGGSWTRTELWQFTGEPDGAYPQAGLIFDGAGNLYGTTQYGGVYGAGSVFELSPGSGGAWSEKIVYSFLGTTDGSNPDSQLVIDPAGNLYGTTYDGGSGEQGVVFELSPVAGGGWTESVLQAFVYPGPRYPTAGLVRDSAGNLYGSTFTGGNLEQPCLIGQYDGCGIVFELSPNYSGTWTYNVILTFDGFDGALPHGRMAIDGAGNLYGATSSGGNVKYYGYGGFGTVFRLSPNSSGAWTETVLHVFGANAVAGKTFIDGDDAYSSVTLDSAGNLYGTTVYGGTGYGDVYKLSPSTTGAWKEKTLFAFSNQSSSGTRYGIFPEAGVLVDSAGNVFGTTLEGGTITGTGGVVFEITP